MLVLSRKVGEEVIIDGEIRISVVRVRGNRVRIGIQAPADVCIRRQNPTTNAASPGTNPDPPLCPTTGCPS
jgi:carbon storage regulator